MSRRRAFKAPPVSIPPDLVVIEWIDAQSEHEHDGPSVEAGGLVRLPAVGYHVNTKKDENGRYIVLAREFSVIEGVLHSRDHFSVWVDKIVSWKVVRTLEQVWPENEASGTSTSSTKTSKAESTTSSLEMSAGANPSASEPTPKPSS